MKVAVLGSLAARNKKRGWRFRREAYFRVVCEQLGRRLAEEGHQLIVARTNRDTADQFVLKGFKNALNLKRSKSTPRTGRGPRVILQDQTRTPWAKAHLDAVKAAMAVIALGGGDGTYAAGQTAILLRKRLIPIPMFGGAAAALFRDHETSIDDDLVQDLRGIRPSKDLKWLHALLDELSAELKNFPRLLVIHGRSQDRNQLKDVLLAKDGPLAGVPTPIIMMERISGSGQTVPELFENIAPEADGAIAIITPEDIGAPAFSEDGTPISAIDLNLNARARENVWVEVGWIWGRLGRGKVMLLRRGKTEMPSDLGLSIICHEYKKHPRECMEQLETFINNLKKSG
jgi:hypothetical protein